MMPGTCFFLNISGRIDSVPNIYNSCNLANMYIACLADAGKARCCSTDTVIIYWPGAGYCPSGQDREEDHAA